MGNKIKKEDILKFLHQFYELEKDYNELYGHKFDNVEEGFKELVRVYNTYPAIRIWPTRVEDLSRLQSEGLRQGLKELGKNVSEKDNILEFIKGERITAEREYHPHQWHLNSFYKETADILSDDFLAFYRDIDSKKDFEEVFDSLKNVKEGVETRCLQNGKNRKLGFGQVCLYDTSLRMVYCKIHGSESHHLFPKKYVYLHTKPLKTAKILKELGILQHKPVHKNETKILQKIFLPFEMSSIDIENFMCVMLKPIGMLNGEGNKQ